MDLIPFKFQNERQNLKKKKPSGGMRLRRYAGIMHQLESKQEIDGILKPGKLEGFFFSNELYANMQADSSTQG